MIQDGDSVATLMRMADEHRPRCEREEHVAAEAAEEPAYTPAEARLQSAGRTFAVLHRLDYHTWDAWLRPADAHDAAAGARVTRNCCSYEMAVAAVFRAMGAAMPADFTTVYAGEQPDPASIPAVELSVPPGSRLPMSYERHLIRYGHHDDGHNMMVQESGRTAGIDGVEGSILEYGVADGTSLATLIQRAGERWPIDMWTICPADERAHPELTVQKNAGVYLSWYVRGEQHRAALRRQASGTWDAWVCPLRAKPPRRNEPTQLLTPASVSYEMALAAIVRALGDDMPTGFAVAYLDR
jgi:hypothetical protein